MRTRRSRQPKWEMVLLQHPGVRPACVLGRPCTADIGDMPTAFVARVGNEAGEALTEGELQDLVDDKLSDYKRLRGGVVFLDHLPWTVSGKVTRHNLREMLKEMD
ncbi:hypothetical protein FOCC_FOCC007057 [Frankliniella occidentalis]|nr:hypothetical protein FOCC_FOCC007057 [Frankliniella occidentalis]